MDGEKAVALTTQTSEPLLSVDYFGSKIRMFYGRPVPDNIADITVFKLEHGFHIRWVAKERNSHSVTTHSMPLEQTNEGITAAIVAMKLS